MRCRLKFSAWARYKETAVEQVAWVKYRVIARCPNLVMDLQMDVVLTQMLHNAGFRSNHALYHMW
jgi:hypothetical protein